MSLKKLDQLIEQNVAEGADIVRGGPVTVDKIQRAEELLGVAFPPSYKDYLTQYGAIEIDGRSFAGLTANEVGAIGDVVAFTKNAREQYGIPDRYIALDFQDGDVFLCIDTQSKDSAGESPLVLISPVNGKQQGAVVSQGLVDYLEKYLSA
ncbi:SMI1/KNR4 family protein [Paraburkholderia antibiotica]|uniref:SMI1/KNR4 family protein n=1 Tax=Paraburkholderia antibiotica TaxID=2728839 RepID=A0A7Y0A2Y2_9BURK|nr:SMI1/KNR4 family protein [Paraburkholderia antibiotica]NML35514.1 SMI1/KNR4 family protein [Paraburkholderia antibiotica]